MVVMAVMVVAESIVAVIVQVLVEAGGESRASGAVAVVVRSYSY